MNIERIKAAIGLGATNAEIGGREGGREIYQAIAIKVKGRPRRRFAASVWIPEARRLGDLANVERDG